MKRLDKMQDGDVMIFDLKCGAHVEIKRHTGKRDTKTHSICIKRDTKFISKIHCFLLLQRLLITKTTGVLSKDIIIQKNLSSIFGTMRLIF